MPHRRQDKEDGGFESSAGAEGYPWLSRTISHSDSESAKQSLMLVIKNVLKNPKLYKIHHDSCTTAAHVTGKSRYIQAGMTSLYEAFKNTYYKDGDFHDGMFQTGNSLGSARAAINLPLLMAAAFPLGSEKVKPLQRFREKIVLTPGAKVLFLHEQDTEFKLHLLAGFRRKDPAKYPLKPAPFRMIAPDGSLTLGGSIPLTEERYGMDHELVIPKDGKRGIYGLEIQLPEGVYALQLVYPVPGGGKQAYECDGLVRFRWPVERDIYFYVPRGTPSVHVVPTLVP